MDRDPPGRRVGRPAVAVAPGEAVRDALGRRELLLGSIALGLGAGAATWGASTAPGTGGLPTNPRDHLRNIVRMQGSLREEDVPWWFTGVIFAVTGESQTPRPLVRFEGMEVYWFRHLDDGYLLGGHTVTFFRDFETQEFLRESAIPGPAASTR